ncbi:MAG: HelD family protein [Acidimicrobiales bacterium]
MPTHPELSAEQEHIDRAYRQLEAMREFARSHMSSVLAQGKGGTAQAREERDVIVRRSLARLQQLDIGREALCFGRIDQAAAPAGRDATDASGEPAGHGGDWGGGTPAGPETFYIGRLAVSGPEMEPLVVDWRAPVAEPFYRATGAHPMGLVRRRHFLTDGPVLLAIEDEVFGEGDIGQTTLGGILVSALDRARTGRMRDIVATIQKEQDEIIRAPLPGVLVVQGGPGTGKTAVALHRAAYLLYTHRFPLERQGVLVIGPNQLFLRYIESVLPSLGESGAVLSTLAGLVSEVRVRATDAAGPAALKGEARLARVLARAVRDRQRPLRAGLEIPFGSLVLRLSAEDTAAAVMAGRRRQGAHNRRRRYVESELFRRIHRAYLEAVGARELGAGGSGGSGGEGEVPERDGGLARVMPLFPRPEEEWEADQGEEELDEAELRSRLRRHPVVVEALERMWPRLLPEELVHDLLGAPALLASAGKGVLSEEEVRLLYRRRSSRLEDIPWTAADIALVDEAKLLVGTTRPNDSTEWPRTYGHIVVDEAQDLSPMQLRMLARRSTAGSMTVVGDVAQATGALAPPGWEAVVEHLTPRKEPTVTELSVNYRTPAEIMDVAAGVLAAAAPGLVPPQSVRSTGSVPRFVAAPSAESLAKTVAEEARAELAAVEGGTVALVCPDAWLDRLTTGLEQAGLEFGLPERDGLDRPVTLVPVGVVKGLEFDSVIVIEPAAVIEGAAQGLRALYVALTRATRRLSVVHHRPLPDALRG